MKLFIKSILAGIMIGLAGFIYLRVDNKYIGAFLFSLGLLTIIIKDFNLFTGKVYRAEPATIVNLYMILLYNCIGSFGFGLLIRFTNIVNSDRLWAVKYQNSIWTIFMLSIGCGILMYLAVSLYSKTSSPVYVILPIMGFILSGCEHCIANMFYMSVSSSMNLYQVFYILINIIGNALGSILFYRLEAYTNR